MSEILKGQISGRGALNLVILESCTYNIVLNFHKCTKILIRGFLGRGDRPFSPCLATALKTITMSSTFHDNLHHKLFVYFSWIVDLKLLHEPIKRMLLLIMITISSFYMQMFNVQCLMFFFLFLALGMEFSVTLTSDQPRSVQQQLKWRTGFISAKKERK